jgi:hypothetical protein
MTLAGPEERGWKILGDGLSLYLDPKCAAYLGLGGERVRSRVIGFPHT